MIQILYYNHFVNSCAFFCLLRQEDVFRAFPSEDEVKHSNDPPRALLKFDGGSFEPIKFFSKIFFTGSLTGSESEIFRFDKPIKVILVEATSSCYQFMLRISESL